MVAQALEEHIKQMAKYLKKLKGCRKQKLERIIALLKYYNFLDLKKTERNTFNLYIVLHKSA